MEAVRVRKPKLKTADIIARLESIKVPDEPLPVESEVFENFELAVSQPEATFRYEQEAVHLDDQSFSSKEQTYTYPSLDDHFSKPHLEQIKSVDSDIYFHAVDEKKQEVKASAPILIESMQEEDKLAFDNFPAPLSSEHLRNLYINRSIDRITEIEQIFLKGSEFELEIVSNSNEFNPPEDPFHLLLYKYADNWGKWWQALKRLDKVLTESSGMEQSVWMVTKVNRSVEGKCQDKKTVYLKYEYEKAELSQSVLSELNETNEVSRWIIFEEIPLIAYQLVLCRNRIEEYLANILTQCSIYENLTASQPGILIGPIVDCTHLVQLKELRSTCSILFACLRQFWLNQYGGRTHDPTFLKHVSNWLILTAGLTVRACRPEDHVFILMQLLRLPSQLIKLFVCLLQPPDPTIAWERTKNLVDFLYQPEVELILTLFSVCLRPVRERERFVTPLTISTPYGETNFTLNKDETLWTTVDSAGESDTEDRIDLNNKRKKNSTSKLLEMCTSSSNSQESCTYLSPDDLDLLLGQLRIERLLQLLAYDYIPQRINVEEYQINESGFMTSIAFADRMLSLIEACEKIYSDYVPPPGPQTHLGSWRSLAKRLARLIRLLLIAIGYRIQNTIHQQHHYQGMLLNSQEFMLILSQYDSLCLRATRCLLVSGSGLPESYRKAGLLTCWRNLACTLPLECIMHNNSDLEFTLPDIILDKLHHVLLSIGLNELGLSVVISVLGKLASYECRPRIVFYTTSTTPTSSTVASTNTSYRYELVKEEAVLIKCILRIIFGLSIYHRSQDVMNIRDSKTNLITESALDITKNPTLTSKLHSRITQLNLCFTDQYVRVEEILFQLVTEAPFHVMQPTDKELEFLINSLCQYTPNCFLHRLCRLLLSRFSWDAFKDLQSGEPFIPLSQHLNMALGLCEIVDKYAADLSHFNLSKLINPTLVSNIYKSAKIKSSGINLPTSGLEVSRRTHSVENITSQSSSSSLCSSSNSDPNLSTIKDTINWAVELLLRLFLPGTIYDKHYSTASKSCQDNINQIWFKLYALDQRKKHSRTSSSSSSPSLLNPVTSFVILSLKTVYSASINSTDDKVDISNLLGTSTSNSECQFWGPESQTLNTLIKSIFSCKHFKLTLQTSSSSLYLQLSHCLCDFIYWLPSFSPEEEQHLQQFWDVFHQFSQNPIVPSSSSSAVNFTVFLPYFLIGMFMELMMNSLHISHLLNIIKVVVDIILDSEDCFNNLYTILLLESLLTFEYWCRLQFPTSFTPPFSTAATTSSTTTAVSPTSHHFEEYKLKLRLTSSSVFQSFQVKFKEIEEFFMKNKSYDSLQHIVTTSLETAYTWAWYQTAFVVNTLKLNLIKTPFLSNQMNRSINSEEYGKWNNSVENSILHECIFNQLNTKIIHIYLKNKGISQLNPPYWLLIWLQSAEYIQETSNDDIMNNMNDKLNYQQLRYWKCITPLIYLYQDEIISAGNQLLVNCSTNSLQSSPYKDSNLLLPSVVKHILQKFYLKVALVS
ncbi:unnamed protein product [Heterobilharzia americana]|nr:unnamed protein product [Heterobilharzia americana]